MFNRCVEDFRWRALSCYRGMCNRHQSVRGADRREQERSANAVGAKPHVQNVIQRDCSYVFFQRCTVTDPVKPLRAA